MPLADVEVINDFAAASQTTAQGVVSGATHTLKEYKSGLLCIDLTSVGSGGSLEIKLWTSHNNGTTWFELEDHSPLPNLASVKGSAFDLPDVGLYFKITAQALGDTVAFSTSLQMKTW